MTRENLTSLGCLGAPETSSGYRVPGSWVEEVQWLQEATDSYSVR